MNIYETINRLTLNAMRALLIDRVGYKLPDDASERFLRNTILDDYENGPLYGRDIREMAEDA